MGRDVTLKDVAARAGVSRTTASNVITGSGRFSTETSDKVHRAMRELGYVYNRGAASLRTQQTRTVGVVVTRIASPFWGEFLVGLEEVVTAAGYLSMIVASGDDPVRQGALVAEMREQRIAGLAIAPATGTPARLVAQLQQASIPHVMMTRAVEGAATWYVGPDDVEGGRLAAEHLIGHGCRRLAYVGGPSGMQSRHDRLSGVRKAMVAHGLDPAGIRDIPSTTSGAGGLWAGERLMEFGELPDGIVCHTDTVATGIYRALRSREREAGIRITGYDDIVQAALYEPPLTTVSTRPELQGRQTASLLLDLATAGVPSKQTLTAEGWDVDAGRRTWLRRPELRIRRSCGC